MYCHCWQDIEHHFYYCGYGSSCYSTHREWRCRTEITNQCKYGDIPCKYGHCLEPKEACGNHWVYDVKDTCKGLTGLDHCDYFYEEDEEVCPLTGQKGFANYMESPVNTKNGKTLAALDTVWWANKLRSMAVERYDNVFIPEELFEFTQEQKDNVKAFSCDRNIPDCQNDDPNVASCIETCNRVTEFIRNWEERCKEHQYTVVVVEDREKSTAYMNMTLADAANYSKELYVHEEVAFDCLGLDYVRDCDGALKDVSNPWPSLCHAHQQYYSPTPVPTVSSVPLTEVQLGFIIMIGLFVGGFVIYVLARCLMEWCEARRRAKMNRRYAARQEALRQAPQHRAPQRQADDIPYAKAVSEINLT